MTLTREFELDMVKLNHRAKIYVKGRFFESYHSGT